ncbi:MAG: hypothetical protein QOH56_3701 [Pseudonocardiales bacterium]|nr:hypothetical protein [Pseudonocardiales bacterium]
MTSASRAGRRLLAAVLLGGVATTVAACAHPAGRLAAARTSVVQRSVTPWGGVSSSADHARVAALTAMRTLHSYAFSSTARLGSGRTTVQGRALLPTNLTYTIATTATRTEVTRLGNVAYARSRSGPWKKLTRPAPANPPLHSLLAALTAARAVAIDSGGQQLTATLNGHDAAVAGLVTNGNVIGPVSVGFRLDAHHHVTVFTLTATLSASGHGLPLSERTDYSAFNAAAPITAP